MKIYNCIVVFDHFKENILFCRRVKDPYEGLFNFPGGKVEAGEEHTASAYRELFEETGISQKQISLFHLMDLTYYYQDFSLEIYVGKASADVTLREELNPLMWISLKSDFTDISRFAGEGNIRHIINVALKYPL